MTDTVITLPRSAVEQALEALERNTIRMPVHLDYHFEAIKALRAALEQPQDIAYHEAVSLAKCLFRKHFAHEEDYASGRVVWEPCDTTVGVISQIDNMVCGLVRQQPQVEQEPVAWVHADGKHQPLYTHPQPPRQPLTDDEIEKLFPYTHEWLYEIGLEEATKFARSIEAAHGIWGEA